MSRAARRLLLAAALAAVAVGAPAAPSTGGAPAAPTDAADPARAEPGSERRPRALSLAGDGAITTGTAEYVEAGLARARAEGFDLVVVTLDTPGGELNATRDVVQRMLASPVPIAVWVGPAGARAGSAGVFVTLAANVAAMHPASNIGAAHPVSGGGRDVEESGGKEMARKVENDTAAFARSVAAARGRNAEWAEKAVRESVSVTAAEAVRLKVVDLLATDVPAVLAGADGRVVDAGGARTTIRARDARIEPQPMTIRQRTLAFLADPNIAALLLLLGTLGIALELYHPGSLVPGIAGGICLLLAFLATRVIPVNAGAVVLLLVGVALVAAESLLTTHGVAGAAGAACMVVGTLLFVDRSAPDWSFDPAAFRVSPLVVWPTPIAIASLLGFVAWKVAASRRARLVSGAPGLVGERGEALTEVGPRGGEAFIHGEYWRARSEAVIPKGAAVRVARVEGLVAVVEVVADSAAGR